VICKSVYWLELVNVIFVVYLFAQVFLFPESPRFNYSKERFSEAKNGLSRVAMINAKHNYNKNFKFDTEKELEDLLREGAVG